METQPEIDFGDLAVRLSSYGLRVFAEFGIGGRGAMVAGVGLSVEDFVWDVLSNYAEGALSYEAERGELFSLLARALRNDIIDALRKAAHSREEARSPLPRESRSEGEPPALDELPASGGAIDSLLAEDGYRARLLAAFAGEPELAEVVRVVLDLDLTKPREIAEELGIPVTELQNRKKRLRRRLIEYRILEVSET
jgi:DNA-directed RNA polymerase specialized sigma24 family protein